MRILATLFIVSLLAGCGTPSFLITPVTSSSELQETVVQSPPSASWSDKILILPIDGMIMNARTGTPPFSATENQVALISQQLERAEQDSSIKAIVLRINSPGGTVTGSDTVYTLLMRFREKTHKPIIASCQEICASGGYYIACASDQIVAQPTSLVGSIGVIFQTISIEQLLSNWGIVPTTVKSAVMKDIGSPLHNPTPAEKEVMQALINEYFARFKSIVGDRRHLSADQLVPVTDGRVFSGATAQKFGLVDKIGTLEDALDVARELSGAKSARAVMLRRPFGAGGSIYASSEMPSPQANSQGPLIQVALPSALSLPTGFYFLWQP